LHLKTVPIIVTLVCCWLKLPETKAPRPPCQLPLPVTPALFLSARNKHGSGEGEGWDR